MNRPRHRLPVLDHSLVENQHGPFAPQLARARDLHDGAEIRHLRPEKGGEG
jgi:hypothetical protein